MDIILIFFKMEEERPPTKEEIDELRERTKDFVAENGEGNVIFCRERFAKTVQIFDLDSVYSADVKRILTSDEYVGRFFLHCTDIPGDHLKNTEEMIIRSLKFRKKQEVLGDGLYIFKQKISIFVKVIRVITFLLHFLQMFGQKI